MDDIFRVGAATVEITPEAGLLMDGYVARQGTSVGAHDPLMASVLVVEHGERRAALVTLDVMAVSRRFTDSARRDLAALLGSTREAILICASHTHAGPRGLQDRFPVGTAELDRGLAADVAAKIRLAAERALDRRRPARLRWAAGEVPGVAADRNRPERPVDTRVSALVVEGGAGEPDAIAFHFACHPTVLSAANLYYSADLPGAARRRIRDSFPNAVCLFLNGAAANVSTRFTRHEQSLAEVERLGRLLGDRVVQLVEVASEGAPALAWVSQTLSLPLRVFPDDTPPPAGSGNARIDTVRAEGAAIQARLRSAFQGRESEQAEISALRIGPWVMLGVPGEAFNDLARELDGVSSHALVAGYANDYLGYFPTRAAIEDATYEALSSPFDERAHRHLRDGLAALLDQV